MAKVSVYSILGSLLIALHSITAFSSNIHTKMTEAEKLTVFGSLAHDPLYKVFPMSLTGMRRSRKSNRNIIYTLSVNSEEFTVNLKPTKRYLASKYTGVWSAVTDQHTSKDILYRPLTAAMKTVGEFTMYQDVENAIALAVYTDPTETIVIEGTISSWYAIRSLPKRLIRELRKEVDITDTSDILGGAITSMDDMGFYAVTFISMFGAAAPSNLQYNIQDDHEREKRAKANGGDRKVTKIRNDQKTFYPEMLIVLDRSVVRDRTTTQVLRNTLAFWNGMDLIYRTLDKPKIRLNIAGIIIAADDMATPYIAKNAGERVISNLDSVLSKMGRHFYKERARFPMNRYDIIVAMTAMALLADKTDFCRCIMPVSGYANRRPFCSSSRNPTRTKTLSNTMIMHYDGLFTPEHLFLVQDNHGYDKNADCHSEDRESTNDNPKFEWSDCSKKFYSHIFAPKNTECLLNKPLSLNSVNKVLPSGALTMDKQCQNEGYSESCKLPSKMGPCEAKGCRDEVSNGCVRSKRAPLPGSQCGTNKYCNKKKQCVYK